MKKTVTTGYMDDGTAYLLWVGGLFVYKIVGKEVGTMPIIDMIKTGQNIVILRKQAGLSVRDLQDTFGFSTPQAIYKWQQGLALPTIDNLVILAALLGVTIDDILVTDKADKKTIIKVSA